MNQSKVPKENIEYIPREMPDVLFVLIVFNACGKKEDVVDTAAKSPIIVVILIYYYYLTIKSVREFYLIHDVIFIIFHFFNSIDF
ncbi:MAG: hypothetical protein ABI172_03625 [Ginsengibacter sp.]